MNLSPLPIQKFFANNGRPLVSGKLFTYTAGTTTKVATYTDSSGGTPNTNPIILNFRGECRVWIDPTLAYKFVLSPSNDTDPPTAPIWTVDNITASPMPFDNTSDDTGTVNNISLTIPRISSPVAFTRVVFKAANTNTGATTLQINGGTTHPVIDQAGNAMTGGEITKNGMYEAIYDGSNWQLQWQLKYPRSAAETAAGLVPSNYRYPVGHGRRYGMKGDNTTNDSAACQTWLQFCYDQAIAAEIDAGVFKIGDVAVSVTGNRLTSAMKITGAGFNSTKFVQNGSPTLMLAFNGTAAPNPSTANIMMRDISFYGTGKTCRGLVFNGIASFYLQNVSVEAFTTGFDLLSSLVCEFKNCVSISNNIGIKTRLSGGAYCNLLAFNECLVNSNSQFGFDFGAANGVTINACDIERNGAVSMPTSTVTISNASPAVVTWNAHGLAANDPVIFTTTGALPSPLVVNQIYYVVLPTANTFRLATAPSGADINTTTAGSGTHTAKAPNTGAVVLRADCIDEIGSSTFTISNNWFELNIGAAIRTEYMSSAIGLQLHVCGGHIVCPSNFSLAINSGRNILLTDLLCIASGDIANISTDQLSIRNSRLITLVRPSVTDTVIIGSSFNGIDYPWGETGSSTLTLTGCTTSPTGSATWLIQGKEVTVNIPAITGTSNTTAATLTGLDSKLWPSATRNNVGLTQDNGTEKVSPVSLSTSGVFTLNNAFSGVFTNSGTKGVGSGFTFSFFK